MEDNQLFNNEVYRTLSLNREESIDEAVRKILRDSELLSAIKRGSKELKLYEEKKYTQKYTTNGEEHYKLSLNKEGLRFIYTEKHSAYNVNWIVGSWKMYAFSPVRLNKDNPFIDFTRTRFDYEVEENYELRGNGKNRIILPFGLKIKDLENDYLKGKKLETVSLQFSEKLDGYIILRNLAKEVKNRLKL